MKSCRKLLEEDLGLPEKSLADRKEFIQKYVDKVNMTINILCVYWYPLQTACCCCNIWDKSCTAVPQFVYCTDHSQQSI